MKRYEFKTKRVTEPQPHISECAGKTDVHWCCTGAKDGYASIVCYIPDDYDILDYWSDAFDIQCEKKDTYKGEIHFPASRNIPDDIVIIHCPKQSMATDLRNLLPGYQPLSMTLDTWQQHQEKTCYGICKNPNPQIVFFGSFEDEGIKGRTILEFQCFKQAELEQSIKESVQTQVFVSMTRGDIEDACGRYGIRITKNRSAMERKLIDKMVAEQLKQIK